MCVEIEILILVIKFGLEYKYNVGKKKNRPSEILSD